MQEFLYTTLVLFPFFFIGFLVSPVFKYMKMIMIIIQLIFSFILVSKNFYKKHSLYSAPRVKYIQSLDFYPINYIYKTNSINGTFINISYDTMSNNKFSLIQTKKYSTQCLEYYFIQKNEACPITDIKFDNKFSKIYQDSIQISHNEYLYYTNQNKLGKLYKSFYYSKFERIKEDVFTNEDINKIARKEFNKISNPILNFKYFINFFDVICPMLIITSLCFSFFEPVDDLKLGVLRIMNISMQIIILIIYIVRFYKFIKVKQCLFDNEDIYKNDSYFSNKNFNKDSFPLALSINLFIINILYIACPNHELCLKVPKNFLSFDSDYVFYFFIIFFFISKFIFEIFDLVNDKKINIAYNNIIYNWKLSPMKSINLAYIENKDLGHNVTWKGCIFQMEQLLDYNYINIFSSNNSKLCGKDNYENELYFPQNVDCPINDIFISEINEDLPDYKKLKLDNSNYLYYTNQSTEGKIVIDLRIGYASEIPLNPMGYLNYNYYSIPFYEELDFVDNKYLYSINYLGINSSAISGDKIKKFEKKIAIYKSLYITKIVFLCIEYICLFFILIMFIFKSSFEKCCLNSVKEGTVGILYFFAILINLIYFIIIIVCLDYHRKYVTNFMNKINFDLTNHKNDYKWNVAVLIHFLFAGIYAFLYFVFENKFEFNNSNYNSYSFSKENRCRNSLYISKFSNEFSGSERQIEESKKTIKDLNTKISTLNQKINDLTKERDEMPKKIEEEKKKLREDLKKQYIEDKKKIEEKYEKEKGEKDKTIKDLNQKLTDGKNKSEKSILDLNQKLNEEKNSNEKYKKIIKEKDKEIAIIIENNKQLLESNNKYKKVANALNSSISFNLSENEKLISIIIQSQDQVINNPIICKNSHKFNEVENLLYEKFPDYKKSLNVFLLGSKTINNKLTLDENKIKDGDIITMTIFDDN